jgi:hypothetical protein
MYHMSISTMKCLNKVPKNVSRSPTYVSNHAPYHQPYTSKNMPIIHRPCTITCTKKILSMVYLNQLPMSSIYVSHTYSTIYQVCVSTMYQHHKDTSLAMNHNHTKPNIKIAKSVLLTRYHVITKVNHTMYHHH